MFAIGISRIQTATEMDELIPLVGLRNREERSSGGRDAGLGDREERVKVRGDYPETPRTIAG